MTHNLIPIGFSAQPPRQKIDAKCFSYAFSCGSGLKHQLFTTQKGAERIVKVSSFDAYPGMILKSLNCALSSGRFIQLQISRWCQVETLHRTVSCRSQLHPPRSAFRWSLTPLGGEARCDLVESDERKAEMRGELTIYRRGDSCAGIQGVGQSKG